LILLSPPNSQVPKGLDLCVGGHDIAFIYPLIPCRTVVFPEQELSKERFGTGQTLTKKQLFEMKKKKSREKQSGRRGSENEY